MTAVAAAEPTWRVRTPAVPTLIFWATESLPILITPLLELTNTPLAPFKVKLPPDAATVAPVPPLTVNKPLVVVKLEAPTASKLIPPAPASKLTVAVDDPTWTTRLPAVPILISKFTALLPMLITLALELISIFPVEFIEIEVELISNNAASISTVLPVPLRVKVPPVEVTVTPAAPLRVNKPTDVVKLDAAAESKLMVPTASSITDAAEPEPTWIARAPAVPTLIDPVTASLPILITPVVELRARPPLPPTVNIPADVLIFEALEESTLNVIASRLTAVADAEPTWTVRAPALPTLIAPVTASLPILITPALELRATPPAPPTVNIPDDVLIFEALAESILNTIASRLTAVAAPEPTWRVRAPRVPTLIFWATESLPILITPALELIATPPAPPTVNTPADVLIFEALEESTLNVIASRFTAVAAAEPTWTVRAPAVPTLIAPVTVSLPILIIPALELRARPPLPPTVNIPVDVLIFEALVESRLNTRASRLTAVAVPEPTWTVRAPELPTLIAPVTVSLPILITPPLELRATPPAPPTVNTPADVFIFEALAESILNAIASRLTAVAAPEPTWTVRTPDVPTLIFWLTALEPTEIVPVLFSNDKLLEVLNCNTPSTKEVPFKPKNLTPELRSIGEIFDAITLGLFAIVFVRNSDELSTVNVLGVDALSTATTCKATEFNNETAGVAVLTKFWIKT